MDPVAGKAPAPAITVAPPPAPEAVVAPPPAPETPDSFGELITMLMTDAFDALVAKFGPMGPLYAFGAVAVLTVLAAAPLLLSRRADPLERLSKPVTDLRSLKAAGGSQPIDRIRAEGGTNRLDPLKEYLEPKDEKELGEVRLKLMQAGYRSRSAVRTFYFARITGGAGLLVLALFYLVAAGADLTQPRSMVIAALGLITGYFAPTYWVTRRQQERQGEIENGFPDALDLMLICVEAGQSLDQSLQRVAKEIRHAHPSLADEYAIVAAEMRAGKDRASVLRDFAQRAGVNDVSSFVTVLIQSATFGTSVAEALRVYASEMRDKRVMRAEEKANKLPTKLTLGTMFFTVPPLMLILIGPSLIDIVNTMSGFR